MDRTQVYIEKPTHDEVLEAVASRLRLINHTSSLCEITLQSKSEFNAYIAIVVPKSCPACLYDVSAKLEGDWGIASRDEMMDNLPAAWLEFDTRLVVDIIDLIIDTGTGANYRFMSSKQDGETIYWITSARMICFFHSSKKAEQ
jgi:hypothetical protein